MPAPNTAFKSTVDKIVEADTLFTLQTKWAERSRTKDEDTMASGPRHNALLTWAGVIAAAVVVVALGFWLFGGPSGTTVTAGDGFFSDDDGKTFFTASSDLLPPFGRGDRQAVAARVFSCAGKPPFVGYLERYTDAGKVRAKELQDQRAAGKGAPGSDEVLLANMELKRPGETTWIKASDPRASAMRKVVCPDDPTRPASPYAAAPR